VLKLYYGRTSLCSVKARLARIEKGCGGRDSCSASQKFAIAKRLVRSVAKRHGKKDGDDAVQNSPDPYRCSLPRMILMPTAAAGEFADKRATICSNVFFRVLP
jgi:hypothetical protein